MRVGACQILIWRTGKMLLLHIFSPRLFLPLTHVLLVIAILLVELSCGQTNRQTETHTGADDRLNHKNTLGLSKELRKFEISFVV